MDRLPDSPGIYAIVNVASGKRYVGSTNNVRRRIRRHRHALRAQTHWNKHLSAAYAKHGASAFCFELLENIPDVSLLREREQWHIDFWKAADANYGYNVSPTADRPSHTAETRARISSAQIGRKMSAASKAKLSASLKASPEVHAHLEKLHRARVGATHSAETKRRLSEMQKGRPNGRKLSKEHMLVMLAARLSKGASAATRKAMSEKRRAWWERQRGQLTLPLGVA